MEKIQPTEARYIKLGERGAFEGLCIREGLLRIDYSEVPDLSKTPSEQIHEKIDRHFADAFERGDYPRRGTATDHARQVAEFYSCGEDVLWITFSRGRLWWCFASPTVEYLGNANPDGTHQRKATDCWRSTSIGGHPLLIGELDGRLTTTAGYRQTICVIHKQPLAYLTRVINDEPHPNVLKAQERRDCVLQSIVALTHSLHPKDFELLVDLVFSQSGWRRISRIGGNQETVDIVLELPSTGEQAFVQVKSKTNIPQFEDYVSRLKERDEDRMFYVYHTGPELSGPDNVTVINAERLAEMILNAGLLDWLIKKSGF